MDRRTGCEGNQTDHFAVGGDMKASGQRARIGKCAMIRACSPRPLLVPAHAAVVKKKKKSCLTRALQPCTIHGRYARLSRYELLCYLTQCLGGRSASSLRWGRAWLGVGVVDNPTKLWAAFTSRLRLRSSLLLGRRHRNSALLLLAPKLAWKRWSSPPASPLSISASRGRYNVRTVGRQEVVEGTDGTVSTAAPSRITSHPDHPF
jgi:hypothetical protein